MQYGLIGEHLSHSYSKEIHEQIADYAYELKELAPSELEEFFRRKEFNAINVTIPYKQTVIPFLYETDAQAKEIGAVNTVVNRGGKLYGYNTDFLGMKALIGRLGICLKDRKVLILGTGGTSKTAHAVAESLGAGEILHVSRSSASKENAQLSVPEKKETEDENKTFVCVSYEEAKALHADAQVIINTTPAGMFPKEEGCPLDISAFLKLEGVIDAVYNPLRTNLVLDAREKGVPAEGGLFMLSAQAVYACGHFLGREAEASEIEKAFRNVRNRKRNLVLIGMPSCGKTTVGAKLKELLGMEVIDTDAEIVKKIGMEIAEYAAQNGETAFRDAESEAVRAASAETGKIIATGGGAILRKENVRALKRNGILVFIDRPLKLLEATPDRPFSSDPEALAKRYEERYGIYSSVCDVRVDGSREIAQVAEEIIQCTMKQ